LSSLQEALVVLLGAESEGVREVQEARTQAEALLKETRERMAREAEVRLQAARKKAGTILENARAAADEDARSITEQGKSERERMERRFREIAEGVVDSLVQETAEILLGKRGRPA
jgi:V/A-type H+-transporting ATPase subunit G/H/F-type H+-transporting ATPase subunit b